MGHLKRFGKCIVDEDDIRLEHHVPGETYIELEKDAEVIGIIRPEDSIIEEGDKKIIKIKTKRTTTENLPGYS